MTEFSIRFVIPGEPLAFARAGQNGKFKYTPKPQSNFMGVIKLFAQTAMGGRAPIEGPVELCLEAVYLHPQSWSDKKKRATQFKTSKPDLDNIIKLAKDAMSKIVWKDDAQVVEFGTGTKKIYGPVAQMTITVRSISAD